MADYEESLVNYRWLGFFYGLLVGFLFFWCIWFICINIGVLEYLEDVVCCVRYVDVRKFIVIFISCKKFFFSLRLGDLEIYIFGNDIEEEVVKIVVKIYKLLVFLFLIFRDVVVGYFKFI